MDIPRRKLVSEGYRPTSTPEKSPVRAVLEFTEGGELANEKPEHLKYMLDYLVNKCEFRCGSNCLSSHQGQPQRRLPYYLRNGCWNYLPQPCLAQVCEFGNKCMYAHNTEEVAYHPLIFRTVPCAYKLLNDECIENGVHCPLAHNDLRQPALLSLDPRSKPIHETTLVGQIESNRVNLENYSTYKAIMKSHVKFKVASKPEVFVLSTFKTRICEKKNQHDSRLCIFYHNDEDRRRIGGYVPVPCKDLYNEEIGLFEAKICKSGDNCDFAHNNIEILYHENVYKTKACHYVNCTLGDRCSFVHEDILSSYEEQKRELSRLEENNIMLASMLDKEKQVYQRLLKFVCFYCKHPAYAVLSCGHLLCEKCSGLTKCCNVPGVKKLRAINNNMVTRYFSVARKLFQSGPVQTSQIVKSAVSIDYGSRDPNFGRQVEDLKSRILRFAKLEKSQHSCVILQGPSGYISESLISTLTTPNRILIVKNGIIAEKIAKTAEILGKEFRVMEYSERINAGEVRRRLDTGEFSHLAVVHEEADGRRNNVNEICEAAKASGVQTIVEGSQGFDYIQLDFSNICYYIGNFHTIMQAYNGISYCIAKNKILEQTKGKYLSLSLDLQDQHEYQLANPGQFRFTPPTHLIAAAYAGVNEWEEEGIKGRFHRLDTNKKHMIQGLATIGFKFTLDLEDIGYSSISVKCPTHSNWDLTRFCAGLRRKNIEIFAEHQCPGTIQFGFSGDLQVPDIENFITKIVEVLTEMRIQVPIKY